MTKKHNSKNKFTQGEVVVRSKTQAISPPRAPISPAIERLRFEFSTRSAKNPQYSMRAFAKHLGISHTLLSLVMNKKRQPSHSLLNQICEKFCLDPRERSHLLASKANSKKRTINSTLPKLEKYFKISLDQFALLSEWQHYAILSLLEIPDTQLTPEYISSRLNISVALARISLNRLFEMNLLKKDSKTGRWKQNSDPIVVENTESTSHTRKFQRQLINKALESMENDPIRVRDLSSTTFAMDPSLLPYALLKIRQFRRELTIDLESRGNKQEVYNLTVQLFPTSYRSIKK